jgi:aryl-alcohol dehydrogenase-like predicted oxidoreductase
VQNRQLGESSLYVSPVIFGAWAAGGWFWGGINDEEAITAMRTAIDVGINCIDTAPVYGFGHSEKLVREAIKGIRDQVVVASKCGLRWDTDEGVPYFKTEHEGNSYHIHKLLSKKSIIWECEESLRRLGIDTIDLYQCHWEDPSTPLEETMEALLQLREQGKIKEIGLSNFCAENIAKCKSIGPVVSNQPRYNPLMRDIEESVLPTCRELNVGTLAYSPLQHGLLSDKLTMDRVFPETDLRSRSPWTQPGNRERLISVMDKVREIASEYSATSAQVIVNWIIGEPGITAAIVGARNSQQVEENIKSLAFQISDQHRENIRALFDSIISTVE